MLAVSSCSTKKNTWLSRTSQATNTRFNVYFNGETSYKDGLKNIQQANKDDYSSLILMFPISKHSNATSAVSNMDRTIEKSRKAIKLHSIKAKPKKNLKKYNTQEYQEYYNQKEFNPALKEAWLLLAKAEFHKADFLGSSATFSYISRYYSNDKSIKTACQLWTVRAYAELGWIYEAEQLLSKVSQNDLERKDIGLFAAVNADLLLKKQMYKEAIPFLEMALSKEKDNALKQRFEFLLAQLYTKIGNNKEAYEAYSRVIKTNPSYEMDFNARISRSQINISNINGVRKELGKMLKNLNNKDYLDQIYFAIGNTYLNNNDTLKAIENYKLSVEKSTRNGLEKAQTLISLGDIYYNKKKYIFAQPCYEDASKIITNEHADYIRITKRAEILNELVIQNNIVLLQDSLQLLSKMPESKRLEIVNKLIEKLIEDEKIAAEKEEKNKNAERPSNNNFNIEEDFALNPPIGSSPIGSSRDWYFYNPVTLKSGEGDFLKKWGKRKLEDNWRRTNKTTTLFENENTDFANNKITSDSTDTDTISSDIKKPEFYLNQIPITEAQISKSNTEIANALFSMGIIYKDKIEDLPSANQTFKEFIHRFGTDANIPDAFFNQYLIQLKLQNKEEAEYYRTKLINEYPDSKYQKILSQADYSDRLVLMYKEQDSIYNIAYDSYIRNDFENVFKQVNLIIQNYPLSALMPKFIFLNALSIGKNDTSAKFEEALSGLISTYPESDVSSMSKDILALIKQGKEAKNGTSSGSLLKLRDEIEKSELTDMGSKFEFSTEKNAKHRFMLVSKIAINDLNKMLYKIATFNFSRFMIKDFDLSINKIDSINNALSITNFETYEEAEWYGKSLASDSSLTEILNKQEVKKVIISEANFAILKTLFSLDEYLAFQANPISDEIKAKTTANNLKTKTPTIEKTDSNKKNTNNKAIETKQTNKLDSITERKTKEVKQPSSVKTSYPDDKTVKKQTIEPTSNKTEEAIKVLPTVKSEEDVVFKNLFTYKVNDPHFVAIYILSGNIDFEKTKNAFENYNSQNYGLMNLKISLENTNKQQVIIIGSFADANVAKSYLIRMVKEKNLFEGLKNVSYRNLLGSQKNLNILMQQNALSIYFEFMQAYYLK